jgi:pimeloyl-ACP methyl ester carboxylesterase
MHGNDLYAEVRGVRLRYRDEGLGPVVILVHGWTLDLEMWEPQVAELAPDYRVIRFDRRGFGLTSGQPSLADDVEDLRALCHLLKLNRVALVGMSQGARVVLRVAESYPTLVASLVLDGAPRLEGMPTANESNELPFQHYRELAQTRGMSAFREEWTRNPLVRLTTSDALTHDLLARMIARYPGKDLTDDTQRPACPASPGALELLAVPVLLISGENDLPGRRQAASELARRLPHAEHAQIPTAHHLCNLDNPRAYNFALRSFLDRHLAALMNHCSSAPDCR